VVLHDLNLAAQFAGQLIVQAGGDLKAFGPPARVLDAALIERLNQVPVEISHDQRGIPCLRAVRKAS
ncbi:ABC transporter ATP-binding protein, partial [Aeromonas veronii]